MCIGRVERIFASVTREAEFRLHTRTTFRSRATWIAGERWPSCAPGERRLFNTAAATWMSFMASLLSAGAQNEVRLQIVQTEFQTHGILMWVHESLDAI